MANILVVDDHPLNRLLLSSLLSKQGHRIREADHGRAALQACAGERPDLIISDVLMPTMDGYDLVRQLRQDEQLHDVPVIFYTAHFLEKQALELAHDLGVARILTRPAERHEILQAVEQALEPGGERGAAAPLRAPEVIDRHHRRILTDKLSETVNALKSANARLSMLISLGQQLVLEREPMRVLEAICRASREIIGARHAALGILETDGIRLRHFLSSDSDSGALGAVPAPAPREGLLGSIVREFRPLRVADVTRLPEPSGLPGAHEGARSFLGAPIGSRPRVHGWLYLCGKLGEDQFTVEDEGLAVTLASYVAVGYENAVLYRQAEAHAARLVQEVAERRKVEQALREQAEELGRSNTDLEQFAYAVSHDLKEPLRTVAGYSQLLMKRYGPRLDDEGRQFIDYAVEGALRMHALVNDLLAYSRVGRAEGPPRRIEWDAVFESVLENLRPALDESDGGVTRSDLPELAGHPVQMVQLFQNLIGNALKFRRAGEPPRVHVSAELRSGQWIFSVRDNGIGVDPRHAERIFAVFQRLHTREEYAGNGIGLAICRRIIERNGGRIWVESEPGRGSDFRFTLPASQSAGCGQEDQRRASDEASRSRAILLPGSS